MAKLLVVLEEWIEATGVSLFLSMLEFYRRKLWHHALYSNEHVQRKLIPAACEVDLVGGLSMYALQLASQKPSARGLE